MPSVIDLWLPILISGVFVFMASSILHMVLPFHRSDYGSLPNEEAVLQAIRDAGVQPGEYMFPHCDSPKDATSPEFLAKCNRGPVGNVTFLPSGPFSMGRSLLQWFVFTLVVSLFVGYIGSLALPIGIGYSRVFRVTATIAVLGYAFSNVMNSIWKGVSWKTTAKFVFDGVVYALLTGGTFGWLWPDA